MIHVSVCICTFRRPEGLDRLLRSLRALDPLTPRHEIIVVDNDAAATAEPVIHRARAEGQDVRYAVEPVRGIARARNRSLELATGEYVAFIDDDEEATPGWLADLWREVTRREVDGAVGPVVPAFNGSTASWLVAGGFFDRLRPPTGTVLDVKQTRTGNALIRRWPLLELPGPFDESYNLSGGEDTDLFARLIERGHRFVAVDSAIVYEHLTAARTTMRWVLRRRFLGSMSAAHLDRALTPPWRRPWRSAYALVSGLGWGALGLLLFPVHRVQGFRYLFRSATRLGRVAYWNGLRFEPYREGSWR